MVAAGKLRGLATTGTHRSTSFPDLPTFEESGIAGFEANAWFGLFAPRGTPDSIVQKIVAETAKALGMPRVREQLKSREMSRWVAAQPPSRHTCNESTI